MKNLLLTALLSAGIISSAFAIDESKISVTIRDNFKDEFKGIENVHWSIKPNFVKATFTYKGETIDAFYDFRGKKIGTSHQVTIADVPVRARKKITRQYPNYSVTEAILFTGEEEDAYYVSLINEKEELVIKVTDESYISLFKKTKKNQLR